MKTVCNTITDEKNTHEIARATPAQCEITGTVEKAVAGNFTAFGELYDIFIDRIYRYVFYQVKDKMTAEDITEEVFLKAWKAIKSCKGREKTFSSWLYRIAHNQMINTLRSMKKFTPLDKVEICDPKQEIGAEMEHQELLATLDCLPEKQKQIIVLKFIEGLDNREIGKITGKSEGAVRITQMRALSTLRLKLESKTKNPKTPVISCAIDKV